MINNNYPKNIMENLNKKVKIPYVVYDHTCIYCKKQNTYSLFHIKGCKHFGCSDCKKVFQSTTILKIVYYEKNE